MLRQEQCGAQRRQRERARHDIGAANPRPGTQANKEASSAPHDEGEHLVRSCKVRQFLPTDAFLLFPPEHKKRRANATTESAKGSRQLIYSSRRGKAHMAESMCGTCSNCNMRTLHSLHSGSQGSERSESPHRGGQQHRRSYHMRRPDRVRPSGPKREGAHGREHVQNMQQLQHAHTSLPPTWVPG